MPAAALRRLAPSAILFLAAAHLAALAACGGPSASSQPPSASIAPPPARGDADGDKRPYADMARSLGTVTSVPVRGRLVMEKGPLNLRASTPKREASQREIPGAEIEVVVLKKEGGDRLTLGGIRSDGEGYISAVFPLKEGTLDRELARAGLSAEQRGPVKALASTLRAELPPARVVQAIYINRTGSPNPDHAVRDWVVPGVTRYHTGAWPLILDLVEEGLCSREAATAVRRRLLDLGQGEKDLDAAGEDGVRSGFLRRETLSAR